MCKIIKNFVQVGKIGDYNSSFMINNERSIRGNGDSNDFVISHKTQSWELFSMSE